MQLVEGREAPPLGSRDGVETKLSSKKKSKIETGTVGWILKITK